MEKEEKNIFYAAVAKGKSGKKRELLRDGLPIQKSGRKFPYLFWEGRNVTAGLWIYSACLPQLEKKLFTEKAWKRETAEKILDKTAKRAAGQFGCREQILNPELTGERGSLPIEIMAVCLYQRRPFHEICLSLPEEGGFYVEQMMQLLCPYLSRIRKAVIYGAESENTYRLKEELYQEFGLVLTESAAPDPEMVWLDLREEKDRDSEMEKGAGTEKSVSRSGAWKFLDTTAKNGYNHGS
ncbi:MAG: hypothetical protein NC429_02860 [Lachnospiraceae bacterium]|nr:hypothetical protein [Lachnospiraceae bacterium]